MINKWWLLVLVISGCTVIDIDGDSNHVETGQVLDRQSDVALKQNVTNSNK